MAVIHYKSASCTTTTVCGRPLSQLNVSYTQRPQAVTCAKCHKHNDVIRAHNDLLSNRQLGVKLAQAQRLVQISFEIDPDMAHALAQFAKRSTFETFARHAFGKDETLMMRDGMSRVATALAAAGFHGGEPT